jgi:glycosyltransferase involved in cell wall biosynthesis
MTGPVQFMTHEFQPFTGGIGVYVEETARAVAGLGADTTVYAPGDPDDSSTSFPFSVWRIKMRGKQDWLCRLRFASAIRRGFPGGKIPGTVVLAEPGPIRLWMYAGLLKLPRPDRLVVILHGSEIEALGGHPRRRQRFRKLLLRADCLGYVSSPVRKRLEELVPEAREKLVGVPGAVRSAWQALPVVERPQGSESPEIIQVGRIHPRKGQLALIEAVGRLPDSLRNSVKVRLIGPTGKQTYLQKIKTRAGELGQEVTIEGELPDVGLRMAYESASLLVMPSQPYRTSMEGLGMALLEAQHFGCPVIGTRVGGINEAMIEGQSGLMVPPDDPGALAGAIQSLLEDQQQAGAMGLAGSRWVRETFSWKDNARQLGLA